MAKASKGAPEKKAPVKKTPGKKAPGKKAPGKENTPEQAAGLEGLPSVMLPYDGE